MKIANRLAVILAFAAGSWALGASAGTITVTDSPTGRAAFGGDDIVSWATLGPEFTTLANTFQTTSSGNLGVTVSQPTGQFQRRNQPTSWNGNFSDGLALLWTGGDNADPLTLSFDKLIQGIGFQINPNHSETITHVEVFGLNNVLFGAFNVVTNNRGAASADFIGFTSSLGDIARITISQGANSDFAINQLSIISADDTPSDVPEPGSMALLGVGLLAAAGAIRRKAIR